MSDGKRITTIQDNILRAIMKGDEKGGYADLDQILERLPHAPTKSAIQFSLRALINRGLIEKAGRESRRGRSRVLYDLTATGRSAYDANYDAFDIIVDED